MRILSSKLNTQHDKCDDEQKTLKVDNLCGKILKAAEDSDYEEEDVLSDSFLAKILNHREKDVEVFEEMSNDPIDETKYYPN